MSEPARTPKPENLVLNLVFNVGLPTAILSWCSGERLLGPKWGLIIALIFPIGYGIYDFVQRRRVNFISIIGFASVLVSGGFGLLKLDGFWFAVKDAAIPLLIAGAVLASMRSKEPLVHEILYNPQVIDTEKVGAALAARGTEAGFERLMRASSYMIAAAMLVSAVLNYGFARYIIRSPGGTEAFNQELARMHWVSLIGISVPVVAMMMLALWRLLKGLEQITGLTFDEIMKSPPEKKPATEPSSTDDSSGSA